MRIIHFICFCCFAMCLNQVVVAKPTSGIFFAYNETDKTVTIAVGDFFPSQYVVEPHSYRTIFVSTNNQNISIKKID